MLSFGIISRPGACLRAHAALEECKEASTALSACLRLLPWVALFHNALLRL